MDLNSRTSLKEKLEVEVWEYLDDLPGLGKLRMELNLRELQFCDILRRCRPWVVHRDLQRDYIDELKVE